jgi:putative exosortase-associated protein (TIGR04073 family)
MKKHSLTLLLASLLMVISSPSIAQEEMQQSYDSSDQIYSTHEQSYGSKIGHKALNGFTNMMTAPLEVPKNIINTINQSNVAYGMVGGLAKGILNTVGRMFTGLGDFITFPLPTKPIVYPAYVWDDFDVDSTYGDVYRLEEKHPHQ